MSDCIMKDFQEMKEYIQKEKQRGKLELPIFVVYDSPLDYRGKTVVRLWSGYTQIKATKKIILLEEGQEVSGEIKAMGAYIGFPRMPEDDKCIREVWF